MSTKVVTAPASQAKRPVRSDKPAQQAENTPAANEDEARLADDSEQDVSVASVHEEGEAPVESETSMAGEFTFGSALAEAAAASGSLISDAEAADEVGFGAFGDDDGSLPLLLGAIGLAALGLVLIVSDGGGGDDEVVPVNQPPTITAPAAATGLEDAASIALGKPTTADADGDTVTVTATATNGTVTKAADGSFSFTPTANFNGTATVTYSATDGKVAAPVTTTQTVTVTPVNDLPVLTIPSIPAVDENSTTGVTFTPTATDVDTGQTLTITATVPAAEGTVTKNADGSFTFIPAANFDGVATVAVSVTDGIAIVAQNASITVNNVGPVITPFSIDIGTANVAQTKDAGTASFNFTDNAGATTNVNITNFTSDDKITVTGAAASDYNFARDFEDINDLRITYTDPGTGATNIIVIQDILPDTGSVASLAALNSAVGFAVLTFA